MNREPHQNVVCSLIRKWGQIGARFVHKKNYAIPVTGREGLWGCEMLRIPHCLDIWLTDGGKVASPTHRPLITPQNHYLSDFSSKIT
jgi:hypothetical protein